MQNQNHAVTLDTIAAGQSPELRRLLLAAYYLGASEALELAPPAGEDPHVPALAQRQAD